MQPSLPEVWKWVLANREFSCFRLRTPDEVMFEIRAHTMVDKCVIDYDNTGRIHGIVLWDVEEYIPLKIRITEALCKTQGSLGRCLSAISRNLPPNFRCIAERNGKIVEYKNPRRIMKLLMKESYGS